MEPNSNDGIAIIGLGGVFPDADSVAQYWENICNNHVAIGDVPADRWDASLYYSPDHTAADKTYSRIGGFVRHMRFDARRFRIPPRTLPAIDDVQKMALTAVADALEDANLEVFAGTGQGRPFDRDNTAVILGNAMGGEAEDRTSMRVWFAELGPVFAESATACNMPAAQQAVLMEKLEKAYKAKLPAVTEDSMPGELSNCITGRIANAFDLRGPNFTTDAACAASLAALQTAVRGLNSGEYSTAIVGGADRSMDPPTYVKFSKIGALSASISAPFDARASGFVMGEGVGVMVLKRLADARRDGDRVYAVIRGIGAASDGRGKGITAPNPRGQRMAIERAYQGSGVPMESISLFEAHGTSTTVGDAVELQVLNELLRAAGAPKAAVPVGSVKSMIGHLKSAAGAAAVIKTALALHHKMLPPSANFKSAPDHSPLHEGYLCVNTETKAWPVGQGPRRAGVSAFGFGGTNFHVILEEFVDVQTTNIVLGSDLSGEIVGLFAEKTGYPVEELELGHQLEADLGIDTVKQAEIMGAIRQRYALPQDDAFRLSDTPTLQSIIDYVARMRPGAAAPVAAPASSAPPEPPVAGPKILVFGGANVEAVIACAQKAVGEAAHLTDHALMAGREAALQAPARLAFHAHTLAEAQRKAADALKRRPKLLAAQGIYLAEGEPLQNTGKIAFLFPGQGSQYVGMMRDLAARYPVVKATFDEANAVLLPLVHSTLTDIVWADESEAADLRLRETQNCQPAMLTADVAMLRLLAQHGVRPDMVAGHSLGEYAAAVAAGVMTFAEALYAVSARGREMAGVKVKDNGKMAVVATDAVKVQSVLDTMDGYVIAANKNCHTQTVIAGESAAVDAAMALFAQQGVEARPIPVSHAFHCRIVAPAAEPLSRVLANLNLQAPTTPILSNVDASYYPHDAKAIVALMAKQLASPVEFIGQLERLYADGARIFVEVGPRRAITGFVRNVLGQRPHRAWAANHHKKPGPDGVAELLAALAADGVPVRFKGDAPALVAQAEATTAVPPQATAHAEPVVIAGMSVALPCPKPVGDLGDDMWAGLLRGDNFIQPVSDAARHGMLARNVVRLNKAGGEFKPLRELADVIQLAAQFGELDVVREYGVDANFAEALDNTSRLAIAVGVDALRDAGLPLLRRYRDTSTGKKLADRWALPPELARTTGVIMACAFPGIEPILDEAARFAAAQGARRGASELQAFVDSWASTLRDPQEAVRLRTAFTVHANKLHDEAALYSFNRKWLLRSLALGHAQLAQLVLAQGPNTQINAACASGPQAIAMAQDWVRLGRCDRVVVVTADDITSDALLPWFGAAFLAAGAATVESRLQDAAVPFGTHRNGMILGAGASGFVVERESTTLARGLTPLADIVSARFANSAYHGTRLDREFICDFVEESLRDTEAQTGLSRAELASRTFFMSHETYTPARGGSSAAEVDALRRGFAADVGKVLVANTKGYSGHPMAATLEDAVAIKGLQRQELPAVANLREVDPAFADLHFAKGGAIKADYAIRFGAGFGSQVATVVYKRRAEEEARLHDAPAYQTWLDGLSGRANTGLEIVARALRVAETGGVKAWELGVASLCRTGSAPMPMAAAHVAAAPASAAAAPTPAAQGAGPASDAGLLLQQLTQLFAEHTGYDAADLAPSHSLEADLGIDTVKQAEIFSVLRERYGLAREENFRLSEVQTLDKIVQYVAARRTDGQASAPPAVVPAAPAPAADRATLLQELTALFAEHTGYAVSDLAPSHALEADLGVDTVKQAEIFAQMRQRYGMPPDQAFKLAEVQTLDAVVDYVLAQHRLAATAAPSATSTAPNAVPAVHSPSVAPANAQSALTSPAPAAPAQSSGAAPATAEFQDRAALLETLTALFAEYTGYDRADLAAGHQLEADLGIDTVKQAEIFGVVRARFGMAPDENFRLSAVQTLDAMVDYVLSRGQPEPPPPLGSAPPPAAEPAQAVEPAEGAAMADVNLEAELTALFAEHTGYEVADLDARHALESDLGIDTVKQAEIFALVRSRYGLPQDETFRLSEVQSIAAIAAYVAQHQTHPTRAPRTGGGLAQDGRFTVRQVGLMPVLPFTGAALPLYGKQVVLAGGDAAARQAFRQALSARGAQVHLLEDSLPTVQLDARFAHLGGAPADALVFLAGDTACDAEALQARVDGFFILARALARARRGINETAAAPTSHPGVLVVGTEGGAMGFYKSDGNALALAALSGLTKTVGKEHPSWRCLTVDVGDTKPWQQAASMAVEAWLQPGAVEQIYSHGQWLSPQRLLAAKSLPLAALPPQAVVLATGGARGVTYALLQALSQRGPLRLVILNRTAGVAPQDSPLHGRSDAEQKALAQAALSAAGERATPAAVRRWREREEMRLQTHANLEKLRALGSEVELWPCDVADKAALLRAAAHVREHYGTVDLLVHGAGIEESRRLEDKDEAALARVFAPKAGAALRLWQEVQPRRMVTMGSVAGRFGNAAQADYAAANELMSALARGNPGFLNIGWTAWDDVGMATRGSVRQVLDTLGVQMLPAQEGVAMGSALLTASISGDVIVAGSLGVFDASEGIGVADVAALPPLFDRLSQQGACTVFSRQFDPAQDRGLDHHRIDGVAVLPGVLGVELLAQAASYVRGAPVRYLRDVRFAAPLKFFRDTQVEVHVEVQRQGQDALALTLVSFFKGPGGKAMRREHFTAVAVAQPPEPPEQTLGALEMAREADVSRESIYERYFHGPDFQVIEAVDTLGENGANGRPVTARPAWLRGLEAASFCSEPLLRETGFQVAGLWEMSELGRMGLPGGIDELWLLGHPAPGVALSVEARATGQKAEGCVFNVQVRDATGRLYDAMRGYRTVTLRDLTAEERFEPAQKRLPAVCSLIVALPEVQSLLNDDAEAAIERYLSPSERARFATLVVPKRRLEWLAVRIAAKRLIRDACFGREGAIIPYTAITIHRDPLGAPEVEIVGDDAPAPRISMSHSDGIAAAFLSPHAHVRPGIDVERVEERDPTFAQTYFSEAERAHATDSGNYHQALTEIWAVKEATLKALGVGARVDFRDVIVAGGLQSYEVSLRGEALAKAHELATANPEVEVETQGNRVIARVLLKDARV